VKTVALIPARYAATRFPGKLLEDLAGKPVIVRTFEAAVATGLFDRVCVVTDDNRIASSAGKAGAEVLMPPGDFATGSDRIAAASRDIDADIIVNIQGDEPFLNTGLLRRMIQTFEADKDKEIEVVSAAFPITDAMEINNPNNVKVVTDDRGFALYFSRSPVPYPAREGVGEYMQHIGIYAFRKSALMHFAGLPPCKPERIEKLENLRFLCHGMRVKILQADEKTIGIDTPGDLEKARDMFRR